MSGSSEEDWDDEEGYALLEHVGEQGNIQSGRKKSSGYFHKSFREMGKATVTIHTKQTLMRVQYMLKHWPSIFLLRFIVGFLWIMLYAFMQMTTACVAPGYRKDAFNYWVIIWTLAAQSVGSRGFAETSAALFALDNIAEEHLTEADLPQSKLRRLLIVLAIQPDLYAIVVFAICTRLFFGPWQCINDLSHGHFGTIQVFMYGSGLLGGIALLLYFMAKVNLAPGSISIITVQGFC
eukprot:TRINITY_DN2024_c0_g1_i1.p1 TRINITY_DN2024_c0_g1~~TRINITY_DN2024_c0_g1_i1.p1  ORF type:complete len:272 (+),score=63.59 TRINITY_DN2024_c0_g1_i1:111-818(+)